MRSAKLVPTCNSISLSLSGGGVRAMAFHLGVLRFIAEKNRLDDISHISTVSGGSLLVGLIMCSNNMHWPSANEFIDKLHPLIVRKLVTSNVQKALAFHLMKPWNWKNLFSRANALAEVLEKEWGIKGRLDSLPNSPEWALNGTTIETGRRFRVKKSSVGDYKTGYIPGEQFKLSEAMAMSAAFPGGIGPLRINTGKFKWMKRKSWDSGSEEEREIKPFFKKLHIYDGGVYDNLGLEPLFDIATQDNKKNTETIVVSDAGKPLFIQKQLGVFNPKRFLRLMNIALDQTRALRVRSFVGHLEGNCESGAYLLIGTKPENILKESPEKLNGWFRIKDTESCSKYDTDLKSISIKNMELIEQHGYEVAKAVQLKFGYLT